MFSWIGNKYKKVSNFVWKEAEKNDKKYIVVEFLSLIILAIIIFFSCSHAMQTLCSSIITSQEIYYLVMLILGCVIVCALQSETGFKIYILLLLSFFVWLSFSDTVYSLIDESLHFEYINHIIDFHKLPMWGDPVNAQYLNAAGVSLVEINENVVNYEVVQAPLYYIIMATVSAGISDAYMRFHVCRLVSLLFVLIVFYFVNKTICYMNDHDVGVKRVV